MILNDNSTQQINTLVIQLQNRITNLNNEFNKKASEINDKISDLDTLKKEIADLAKNNANDSSAMNTQITENKNNIATNTSNISALNTQIQTNKDNIATNTSDISALKTSVAGKADKSHTHTKSEITDFPTSLKNPNALTVNGKTYDGSSAVNAGVQTIANGGTGATTAKGGFTALANGLAIPPGGFVEDEEKLIYKNISGTNWGIYTFGTLWNYINGKISSLFGVTADSNENAWSGKQTFNAGINVAGDIQLNSKTLYPSGYVPRTYFIERATKDNITTAQKELLRKMFAYQSVNRLIQCYGTLAYKINSADKVLGGRIVTVGYFDGDDWLDSNDNISYDDNSTVNFACFGVQEDADDIHFFDMYNLSERVMRNRFDSLNYLLVSRLYFTVLEKI